MSIHIRVLASLAGFVWAAASGVAADSRSLLEMFALAGESNILEEADLGIVNGQSTVGTPYRNALSLSGLFAPPYASSDFFLEVRLFGEKVAATNYRWYPMEVKRSGGVREVRVDSSTARKPPKP